MVNRRIIPDTDATFSHCPFKHEMEFEGVLSGLVFMWDHNNVHKLVDVLNKSELEMPGWLSEKRGEVSTHQLIRDTTEFLAQVGGGLSADGVLSPNTPIQAYNIVRRLGHIEMHPSLQTCMRELPKETYLASIMRLFETPELDTCPVMLEAPPAPYYQLFY